MLRMGPFPEYSNPEMLEQEHLYKIAPFDQISFSILPNEGEMLISGGSSLGVIGASSGGSYEVEYDGTVKLPLFGRINVEGLTARELEKLMEEKYALFLNKPFATSVKITNRKVYVFREGRNSSVVSLNKDNMTIWELMAQTGGVGDAKAHRIKLIRKIDDKYHIFLIDLSRLESIETGNYVLQANDIVYVTPRNRVSEEILFALSPYLSLLSTAALIITLIK